MAQLPGVSFYKLIYVTLVIHCCFLLEHAAHLRRWYARVKTGATRILPVYVNYLIEVSKQIGYILTHVGQQLTLIINRLRSYSS
jgi:hypothetical protein